MLLIQKSCILVTLAFLLTRTRLYSSLVRQRLPLADQAVALLVFLVMGLAEVAVTQGQPALMNLRIVAVCAAGLLAGPWVGTIVGFAVTAMSVLFQGFPPLAIGVSMVAGGLAGGLVHSRNPRMAVSPITGLVLGLVTSLFRDFLALGISAAHPLSRELFSGAIHGFSVALILLVVEQVRQQELQAMASARSEVRELQARMNPHFLFNALNSLSALSVVNPRSIPWASARLGLFLRASFDRHDRPTICLQEEMDVVDAFLDVESLRMGDRLSVSCDVEPELLGAAVPPFVLQPLVENAVRHGLQPSREGGTVKITARAEAPSLVLKISDSGLGMPQDQIERLFRKDSGHAHALPLLKRRLQALYGSDFSITVESNRDDGTCITVRLPLRDLNVRHANLLDIQGNRAQTSADGMLVG